MLRKYFIISWLFLWIGASLMPSNAIEDFVKLPFLFAHHQQKHAELSFWDFLTEHYTKDISHDQEHENLPLHTHLHHHFSYCNVFLIPQNSFVFFLKNTFFVIFLPKKNTIWENHYAYNDFSRPFQPPKNYKL